jgi:hypothetical protein
LDETMGHSRAFVHSVNPIQTNEKAISHISQLNLSEKNSPTKIIKIN